MKKLISRIITKTGYSVIRNATLARLSADAARGRDLDFLAAMPADHAADLLRLLPESQSQLRQDLFVLSEVGLKREGFFVEFGAADGKRLSNTWLLEKYFGWKGVLAEPARKFQEAIRLERGCALDTRCVWRSSGQRLNFNETDIGELSTISDYSDVDIHAEARKQGRTYEVETISLNDLLTSHGSPSEVDYLSIDTEGSEFDILNAVDFKRFRFKVITCEHAFRPQRQKIHALLISAGYVRKHEKLSEFDDWYVLS